MKTSLLFFTIAFILFVNNTIGQTCTGQQEFSISYGLLSGRQIADALTEDEDNGGIFETSNSGNIFLTYRYFLKNKLALGFTVGNQNIQGYMNSSGGSNPGTFVSNYSMRNTTVACEFVFEYINRRLFRFYMLAGIGASFYNYSGYSNPYDLYVSGMNSVSGVRLNCQYDPLGFQIGGRFSYFMELGLGYKGLFNNGFTYRIGKQTNSGRYKYR